MEACRRVLGGKDLGFWVWGFRVDGSGFFFGGNISIIRLWWGSLWQPKDATL